jgi:carboxymethylenebutenolidase
MILSAPRQIRAYQAEPSAPGPWPAVVVVHEAWGLNDDIRRIADRFADNGYVAVAPDLVDGGRIRCIVRAFRDLQRQDGQTVDDLRSVIDWVADQHWVDDGRLGVVGFCMGGGFALLAGTFDGVQAIAPNYGRVPGDETVRGLCPLVASYGAKDRMFARQAERLESLAVEAGIPHDVRVYPDPGHSFMNQDSGPAVMRFLGRLTAVGYHHESAEDAWGRILEFFGTHI